jgi:hypothetical protein
MATPKSLGFQRVSVGGHWRYKEAGRFVSAERVSRAFARAERAEARAAALAAQVARDARTAVREARERAARELAPPPERRVSRARERALAREFLPVPIHRPPAPRLPLPPPELPPPPPVPGGISETYQGPFQVRGTVTRHRDLKTGRLVDRETYLRLSPDRRRRETFYRYAEGASRRVKPLIEALRMFARMGVPWEGVPDNYRGDAIRLALVEPAEGADEAEG